MVLWPGKLSGNLTNSMVCKRKYEKPRAILEDTVLTFFVFVLVDGVLPKEKCSPICKKAFLLSFPP
jgi:hypothetical protein